VSALIAIGVAVLAFIVGGAFLATGHFLVGIILIVGSLPVALVLWMRLADRY
jgi:hypothetical protein